MTLKLPTTKQMKEALLTKQARALKPAGKRNGKDFAKALTLYAGVCASARQTIKRIDRGPQGDEAEQRKARIVSETKSNWADVAPKRATLKEKK